MDIGLYEDDFDTIKTKSANMMLYIDEIFDAISPSTTFAQDVTEVVDSIVKTAKWKQY